MFKYIWEYDKWVLKNDNEPVCTDIYISNDQGLEIIIFPTIVKL